MLNQLRHLCNMVGPGTLAACILAAVWLMALTYPWRRAARRRVELGCVLGVASGMLAGAWVLGLPPSWPPDEDRDRFLLVLLPLTIALEGIVIPHVSTRVAWALRSILALSITPILLWGSAYLTNRGGPGSRLWTPMEITGWLVALPASLMLTWWLLHRISSRDAATAAASVLPLSLGMVAACAGIAIMLSGYATGGMIAFPLAGGLVGIALVLSFLNKARLTTSPPIGIGLVCLFAILVTGRFFASLPTLQAALFLFAPLLTSTCFWRAGALPRLKPFLRLTLVAILAGLTLRFSLANSQPQSQPPEQAASTTSDLSLDDYHNFGKGTTSPLPMEKGNNSFFR